MESTGDMNSRPIVVQKYGGSSVADIDRLKRVAERVSRTIQDGYRVVVVLSAMGKTTDELISLARLVAPDPPRRELDMLLTAGERISCALLSMSLLSMGHEAISFTGSQCGIITNDRHTNARIIEVRPYRVQDELERGRIPVIAGYQGVSYAREVTTLGRGGSDTTAVAISAALGAKYCEICSDVDGVYTADPKYVENPIHLSEISYREMQELALHGAKVLNAQAVEFARRAKIAIYARATSGSTNATKVIETTNAARRIVGVTGMTNLIALHSSGDLHSLETWLHILEAHAAFPIKTQCDRERISIIFSIENCHDFGLLKPKLEQIESSCYFENNIECVSIVGEGISENSHHLRRALSILRQHHVSPYAVEIAPLRISLYYRGHLLSDVIPWMHDEFMNIQPHAF